MAEGGPNGVSIYSGPAPENTSLVFANRNTTPNPQYIALFASGDTTEENELGGIIGIAVLGRMGSG